MKPFISRIYIEDIFKEGDKIILDDTEFADVLNKDFVEVVRLVIQRWLQQQRF